MGYGILKSESSEEQNTDLEYGVLAGQRFNVLIYCETHGHVRRVHEALCKKLSGQFIEGYHERCAGCRAWLDEGNREYSLV